MTIDPLIRRKPLPFTLKPSWRALLALGAFVFLLGAAEAQTIPNSPENYQAQTDREDLSANPLTTGHSCRSFGDPDEDAEIGLGK